VSVPALVVGGVWALAGETAATASAISTDAAKDLNMTGFLTIIRRRLVHTVQMTAQRGFIYTA
jgi:hypothetical protein